MTSTFSNQLLAWFDAHGRKNLPWQHPRSPYRVWLSEIMLQQTQVSTVIDYFERFLKRFPTIKSLAEAPEDNVLELWAGLGYYTRARNLHASAKMIQQIFGGELPHTLEELIQLPGIGRSTAGAILAQAFNLFGVILDGNVKRVLTRYYAEGTSNEAALWLLAEKNTPCKRIVDYTQAIMDLGALVCTRTQPKCERCPLQKTCKAFQEGTVGLYPPAKKRKVIPTQERFFLLITNKKRELLLEKQPSPGIWGGLWSLPSTESLKHFSAAQQEKFIFLPELMHTFSHFKLRIKPVMMEEYISLQVKESYPQQWLSPEKLEKTGLPAPIKKLLNSLVTSEH